MNSVLEAEIDPPSRWAPLVPAPLDAIVMCGLSRDREERFATAREMAIALEEVLPTRARARWPSGSTASPPTR